MQNYLPKNGLKYKIYSHVGTAFFFIDLKRHSMHFFLSKVQLCPSTPLAEKWTITEKAKNSSYSSVIHIDMKTIIVRLFHKQL